jgi:hypothetical protein
MVDYASILIWVIIKPMSPPYYFLCCGFCKLSHDGTWTVIEGWLKTGRADTKEKDK